MASASSAQAVHSTDRGGAVAWAGTAGRTALGLAVLVLVHTDILAMVTAVAVHPSKYQRRVPCKAEDSKIEAVAA